MLCGAGTTRPTSGLPYWQIYRQISGIWQILEALGYIYFRFGKALENQQVPQKLL